MNDKYFKIYSSDDLTVKGSYTMPKTENFAGKKDLFGGFYANGSLTLDGNFTVYGREFSVLAENDVNIASGSLTVSGAGSAGVMSKAGKIIIPDGVKIDAASTSYPLYAKGYDSGLSEKITYPENYPGICAENDSGYQYFIDKEDNIIKHIIIQLGAEKYRVWVGGKQVTSENCSDIFGDGKASYNDADKVLTLNNPTISGAAELNKGSAKIVAEDYLNIVGSYHMSADDKADFGIFSFDSVKLDGDFTFITAKNAINCKKDLIINSGSLIAKSNQAEAVCIDNTFKVENGVKKVDMEKNPCCSP